MPIPVAPISPQRVPAVAESIARGFFDNEIWVWMVPGERRRARLLRRYYRMAIRHLFTPRGGAWTTADAGAGALWAPPGSWPLGGLEALRDLVALFPDVGIGGARRGQRIQTVMEHHHPTERHYYLQTLSVDPAHQRSGYGSALMEPLVERCDAEGMPAYLETQRASNIPFYRRFGFVESDPIAAADGPPLWPMWRDAGA